MTRKEIKNLLNLKDKLNIVIQIIVNPSTLIEWPALTSKFKFLTPLREQKAVCLSNEVNKGLFSQPPNKSHPREVSFPLKPQFGSFSIGQESEVVCRAQQNKTHAVNGRMWIVLFSIKGAFRMMTNKKEQQRQRLPPEQTIGVSYVSIGWLQVHCKLLNTLFRNKLWNLINV